MRFLIFSYIAGKKQGVVVICWTCIQEVFSSNLSLDISYPDGLLVTFLIPYRHIPSLSYDCFMSEPLQAYSQCHIDRNT
jgi:hypothetical protein